MWYSLYSYPFFFMLQHIWYNFTFKRNYLNLNINKINYFAREILVTITLVGLRKEYSYIFLCVFDILVNLYQKYPYVFRLKTRYRKHKYVDICIIKFRRNHLENNAVFIKILNEFFVFFIKNRKKFYASSEGLYGDFMLKNLRHYSKYVEFIDSSILFTIYIRQKSSILYSNHSISDNEEINSSLMINQNFKVYLKNVT